MKFFLKTVIAILSVISLKIAYAETFVVCVIKSSDITSVTINGEPISPGPTFYKKIITGPIEKTVIGGHGAYGPSYNIEVKHARGTASIKGNYYTHHPYMRSFSLKGSELHLTPVAGCR